MARPTKYRLKPEKNYHHLRFTRDVTAEEANALGLKGRIRRGHFTCTRGGSNCIGACVKRIAYVATGRTTSCSCVQRDGIFKGKKLPRVVAALTKNEIGNIYGKSCKVIARATTKEIKQGRWKHPHGAWWRLRCQTCKHEFVRHGHYLRELRLKCCPNCGRGQRFLTRFTKDPAARHEGRKGHVVLEKNHGLRVLGF